MLASIFLRILGILNIISTYGCHFLNKHGGSRGNSLCWESAVSNKQVSPMLFFPLPDFGFKGLLSLGWEYILPPELHYPISAIFIKSSNISPDSRDISKV